VAPGTFPPAQKGGSFMRFQNKKISARATALVLTLGVVGVLVTALPASAAAVTSFTPVCGVVGQTVSITGTGFTGATGVTFNGTPTSAVTFTAPTDTSATAVVPVGATTGTITVETAAVDTASASSFLVAPAVAPTISSFSPPTGAVGTSVVIVGAGFCGTNAVAFNLTPATFTVNSNNQITAIVPSGSTTGPIHVTNTVNTVASGTNFTPASATSITSFTPASGPVGTSVVITGTGFVTVTSVKFNGVSAVSPVTNSATQITAIVPTGATTGPITVVDAGGTATSATSFTVTTAPIARTVTFGFDPHSRVSGQVNVTSGLTACTSHLPVVIQKQKGGSWKWVDTTATTGSGSYKTYIPPSNGKFRAKINQITLVNGVVCGGDKSNEVHS
jgi:hypothetical protein